MTKTLSHPHQEKDQASPDHNQTEPEQLKTGETTNNRGVSSDPAAENVHQEQEIRWLTLAPK